jgi:hypothetical protein
MKNTSRKLAPKPTRWTTQDTSQSKNPWLCITCNCTQNPGKLITFVVLPLDFPSQGCCVSRLRDLSLLFSVYVLMSLHTLYKRYKNFSHTHTHTIHRKFVTYFQTVVFILLHVHHTSDALQLTRNNTISCRFCNNVKQNP